MEKSFANLSIDNQKPAVEQEESSDNQKREDSHKELTGLSESQAFDELKRQANDLFQKKEYMAAILLYKKALELQPNSAIIHLNLAQVCFIDELNN